jgi:hypothetical protein
MAPTRLFAKYDYHSLLEHQKGRLVQAYERLSDEDAVDEARLKQLKAEYMLDVPTLRPASEMWAEQGTTMVDARNDTRRMFLDRSRPIMEEVTELTVHVPFDGDPGVFNVAPTAYNSRGVAGEIVGNELLLRFLVISNFDLQSHIDAELQQVNWCLNFLREQNVVFDQGLEIALRQAVMNRKRRIETRVDVIGKLTIPIRLSPPKTSNPVSEITVPEHRNKPELPPPLKPTTWDVFISHASPDKEYVKELQAAFNAAGISVWVDDSVLLWGNRFRKMIDQGLKRSRYVVVVLSKEFLDGRQWTEYELDSAFALETAERERILPLTHGVTQDDVRRYCPALSMRNALDSEKDSFTKMANDTLILLGRRHQGAIPIAESKSEVPQQLRTTEDIKKGETVAYASYWTRDGRISTLIIRKSPTASEQFTLEEPDGTIHEGNAEDIALKYRLADAKLRNSGYRSASVMASGEHPQFNLS